MRLITKIFLLLATLSFVTLSAATAHAAFDPKGGFQEIDKDQAKQLGLQENTNLVALVIRLTNIVLSIAALGAALFIIIAGARYMMAGGDETKAEKAKHAILYAVIGLIVIGLSAAIVNFTIFAIRGQRQPGGALLPPSGEMTTYV